MALYKFRIIIIIISSLSLYHHLYADDTQLFLSFHLSDFQANISHLQNALTSWMTSNLLSLNSSETELLLIRLKRQLSKIHNSSTSIDTTQSARNLNWLHIWRTSFHFWSDKLSALSKSCYHHIRALRCIRPYLDLHTAKTVATSIVHSKLDYCNSL